jgi:aspartyl-tRNA(Asn)/glutamyl-tRNA(Gln) amidotransferase subunit A
MPPNWSQNPAAVTERHLAAIAELDTLLHAFLFVDAAGARQAALAAEQRRAESRRLSPIDGMTIGVKANIAVEGWPYHAGIEAYRHRIAPRDAACVARLRQGGAVLLGLLNMDEAALGDTTENPFFGRTENPLRPGFTAGGSSGGAAAAVAAGLCDAALGTDTLGSVRIPAAYCGIIGHKAPPGGISTEGIVPLAPAFDSVGILAKTAETAAAMRAWLRADQGATIPGSSGSVGILAPGGIDISPAMAEAFQRVVEKAKNLGFATYPVPPLDHTLREIAKAALLVVELEAAAVHAEERAKNPAGFSQNFCAMLDWARSQSPARQHAARLKLAEAAAQIREFCAPHGAVLMPTTPAPAFAFGSNRPKNTADFTTLANIAGLAATAFPVGTSEGMPLSAQAVGADEEKCIFFAAQLASYT